MNARKLRIIALIIGSLIVILLLLFLFTKNKMKLTSSAFTNQSDIPSRYTCDGQNINPPLAISDLPENTKSIVLIISDPDAAGGNWTHWLLWNISPRTGVIPENSTPSGSVQGLNDFGKNSYGGPCPPTGTHHYQFRLYALDTVLNLSEKTKRADLLKAIQNHILGQTLLTGLYARH